MKPTSKRPPKEYIVYFPEDSVYKKFDAAIIQDTGDGYGSIVGWASKQDSKKYTLAESEAIGTTIQYQECKKLIGNLSKKHIDFLNEVIKEVDTSYIETKNELWYIYTLINIDKFIDAMEKKEDGILNDEVIQELFRNESYMYGVSRTRSGSIVLHHSGPFSGAKHTDYITSLEALNRYGIRHMESSWDRSYSIISL